MAKAFSATRESEDEEEEMKYMAKGRDFCLDLCGIMDILSKPMEMMTKDQSLDQYLWSVGTKWWPRVKAVLHAMKEDIEKHLVNDEVTMAMATLHGNVRSRPTEDFVNRHEIPGMRPDRGMFILRDFIT